jgi:hypothetical protein
MVVAVPLLMLKAQGRLVSMAQTMTRRLVEFQFASLYNSKLTLHIGAIWTSVSVEFS